MSPSMLHINEKHQVRFKFNDKIQVCLSVYEIDKWTKFSCQMYDYKIYMNQFVNQKCDDMCKSLHSWINQNTFYSVGFWFHTRLDNHNSFC